MIFRSQFDRRLHSHRTSFQFMPRRHDPVLFNETIYVIMLHGDEQIFWIELRTHEIASIRLTSIYCGILKILQAMRINSLSRGVFGRSNRSQQVEICTAICLALPDRFVARGIHQRISEAHCNRRFWWMHKTDMHGKIEMRGKWNRLVDLPKNLHLWK